MNKVSAKKLGIRIGGLLVVAASLLAACDNFGGTGKPSDNENLSDPTIEWRPIVDQLIADGRCISFVRVVTMVQLSDDRGAAEYANQLSAGNPCSADGDGALETIFDPFEENNRGGLPLRGPC